MNLLNPAATIGHNHPIDPIDEALTAIADLYDEAKNFADGEPINSEVMHDTVTALRDAIHEAGKAADALRVEAKRPLDEQIAAIQDRFNPAIQPKKGMVDRAKASLGELLAAWRKQEADKKAAIAAAARLEAERIAKEAQDAIRASAGNLAAREEAEALLVEARQAEKQAKRDDKAATSGLGLRTVWRAELEDMEKALDWGFGRAPERFMAIVQTMAEGVVRSGMRSVPGFRVLEERVV